MRRRLLRLAVLAVAIFAIGSAVVVALATVDAVRGYRTLRSARGSLASAETTTTVSRIASAQRSFEDARRQVDGPALTPARVIPVIGHHVRAYSEMLGAAAEVSAIAGDAVEELPSLARGPRAGERAAFAADVGRVARRAATRLEAVELEGSEWLVTPFARQYERVRDELDELRTMATQAAIVSERASALLEGPRRYLVLAANNAEMRAGQGMFLSAGVMTISGGRLDLGKMMPTAEMTLEGDGVPLGGSLADLWSSLHPNREWRNLGVSPRFAQSASLAGRMWRERTGDRVDGVMAVDAIALRELLRITGAVDHEGKKIDARNVVDYVLHDQYADVPSTDEGQAARREALARLARSVVGALDGGSWQLPSLADGLGDAAAGRHLLAWSSRRDDQQMWRAAGVDGELSDRSILVGLLNRGGTKLDQFLDVGASLDITEGERGAHSVRLRITVQNETPQGEPTYIAGPHPLADAEAGEYLGILAVTLPAAAQRARIDDVDDLSPGGRDGPTTVVGTEMRLRRGASRTIVVRFELPRSHRTLLIEPSARVPSVRWRFEDERWQDGSRRELVW